MKRTTWALALLTGCLIGCLAELSDSADRPSPAGRPAQAVVEIGPDASPGLDVPASAALDVCSRPASSLCLVWVSDSAPDSCRLAQWIPQVIGDRNRRERALAALGSAPGLSASVTLRLLLRTRESAVSIGFPKDLDFTPGTAAAESSKAHFIGWLRNRKSKLKRISELGRSVLASTSDPGIKARAARGVAGAHADLALAIESASIPGNLRRGRYPIDAMTAYCDSLVEAAKPLWKKAREGIAACEALAPDGLRSTCTRLVADVSGQHAKERLLTSESANGD